MEALVIFDVIPRAGSRQSNVCTIATWHRKNRQDAFGGRYLEASGAASPANPPHNDERDPAPAHKYYVRESCDVNVGELQNVLIEVATMVRAKATNMEK